MHVVIDAQLIVGYYMESVGGAPPPYTAPTPSVIDRVGISDTAYVDSEGHIEQEWRSGVAGEWFEAWFGDHLSNGHIRLVKADTCKDLLKRLKVDCGFPQSGDKWLIRTAVAVVHEHSEATVLLTEDLDFYEPAEKKCASKRRRKLLLESKGCVAKVLRKSEQVRVSCVAVHAGIA